MINICNYLQLKTEEVQYGNTLLPWLQRVSKHRHEYYVVARKDEEQRRQIIVHHEDKYQQVRQLPYSRKFSRGTIFMILWISYYPQKLDT